MHTILQIALLLFSINTTQVFKYKSESNNSAKTAKDTSNTVVQNPIEKRYAILDLEKSGLSLELFKKGMAGYLNLKSEGKVKKDVITLVDFEKSSTEKRMWIIDLAKNVVVKNTLVAHGKNSGELNASAFSNTPNSFCSSLGCYITTDTYIGKHGLSLKLAGLDEDFNSNAESRYIVLHGASYVSEDFIKCNGRLGRSHGCPAVSENENSEIIELIKGGSFLFINGSSENYSSHYINEETLTKKLEFLPPTI